jgi:hypothetical protein
MEYNLNTSVVLTLFLAISACGAIATEGRVEELEPAQATNAGANDRANARTKE